MTEDEDEGAYAWAECPDCKQPVMLVTGIGDATVICRCAFRDGGGKSTNKS